MCSYDRQHNLEKRSQVYEKVFLISVEWYEGSCEGHVWKERAEAIWQLEIPPDRPRPSVVLALDNNKSHFRLTLSDLPSTLLSGTVRWGDNLSNIETFPERDMILRYLSRSGLMKLLGHRVLTQNPGDTAMSLCAAAVSDSERGLANNVP